MGGNVNTNHTTKISDLRGVDPKAIAALQKAKYATVGELEARRIGPHGCKGRLTEIPGISPKFEMQIEEAMRGLGKTEEEQENAE